MVSRFPSDYRMKWGLVRVRGDLMLTLWSRSETTGGGVRNGLA